MTIGAITRVKSLTGETLPAIITNEHPDGSINLRVFADGLIGDQFRSHVDQEGNAFAYPDAATTAVPAAGADPALTAAEQQIAALQAQLAASLQAQLATQAPQPNAPAAAAPAFLPPPQPQGVTAPSPIEAAAAAATAALAPQPAEATPPPAQPGAAF